MIIRACKEDERQEVISLVNHVFRTLNNLKETMAYEFPALLGPGNIDHIIIAKVDNEVVAAASYYVNDIIIHSTSLKSASIGAVCTNERFRGQGIASRILDYIENKLAKENVLLQIISGRRELYTSRGASLTGKSYEFIINKQNNTPTTYELEEYKENDQLDLIHLYNNEPVRYYRSYDQFLSSQQGATYNWGVHQFRILCIKEYAHVIGYIVVDINTQTNDARIKEIAGDRTALVQLLPKLYERLQVERVILSCPWNDPIIPLLARSNREYAQIDQYCTIKTLDYVGVMERLHPYFAQFISKQDLMKLSFAQSEDAYVIQYKDKQIHLQSIQDVNSLLFGGLKFDLMELCHGNEEIYQLLKGVFPIPFVWMNNMNYI